MKINAFIKILVNKSKFIKEQKARGLICNLTGKKSTDSNWFSYIKYSALKV